MRTVILLVVVAIVGVVAGNVAARRELGPAAQLTLPGTTIAPGAKPSFAIDATEYNFGTAEPAEPLEHSFTITNRGDAPLIIGEPKTTCYCTVSRVGKALLAPGEKTEITLSWHGDKPGGFRQHVTIPTNDPQNHSVDVTIFGKIAPSFALFPEVAALGRIPVKESKTVDVSLFGFRDAELKITKITLLNDETAANFAVTQEPLTAAEIREADAQCGWKVRITLKPGLRLGAVRQTIRLLTNSPKNQYFDIPFEAMLVGDITIVGEKWEADRDTLLLGAVKRNLGKQMTLRLVVAGDLRATTTFKVKHVEPEFLQVKIGEAGDIAAGARRQTPVVIEVPPGLPAQNHAGGIQGPPGEIILKTNHPDVPELPIHVRFIIED